MGGDNFKKANSDSDSLLNALNKAQKQRDSMEEHLKAKLQARLEEVAAEYVNTLALEEKIAQAAIKGGRSISLELRYHKGARHGDEAFTKSNTTTGLTFSKTWYDFYKHIAAVYKNEKIKIEMIWKNELTKTYKTRVIMKVSW